jgi:transmembrane sensor
MENRASHSPDRDIVAEASAWFVEFREGGVPAATRARFDEWLRRSPEHIQAYLEVSAAWSELPTSDPEGRIDVAALIKRARASAEDNVIAQWATPSSRTAPSSLRGVSPRPERAPPQATGLWYGLAASILLTALLLTAWLYTQRNAYATDIGEQRTVRLADGSTIELNALSSVRVWLSSDVRNIELVQGQALFHVAKDRSRPFIVQSGVTTVRAVGTQFDVYRKTSGTTVTVLEGEVAVVPDADSRTRAQDGPSRPSLDQTGPRASTQAGQAPGTPETGVRRATILLAAGEQVTVTPDAVSKAKKADVTAATAWTQQRLIFEATPLTEVAAEFNRYNTKKLVIADAALRSLGISGVYSSADPGALIGFLRAQPNLEVTETDQEIRVTRRETH